VLLFVGYCHVICVLTFWKPAVAGGDESIVA